MTKIALLLAGLLASTGAAAACPAYLDHDLRKLHSKDTVNLCDSFEGRPLLIVNTASHCGYTKQFGGLEALSQQYSERGLAVVGFASNDFRQEAKDEAQAADICYKNYGVTFTMIAPSGVKGDDANPVFTELNRQAGKPSWNFNKYLVDRDGNVVERFGSNTRPDDAQLTDAIEKLL